MDGNIRRQIARTWKSGQWFDFFAAALLAMVGVFALPACTRQLTFAHDVKPILTVSCLECHQPGAIGYERSGLDMRSYESVMKGTKFGPIVTPGDSFNSVLMQLVEHRADPSINMPYHRAQLSKFEIETLRTWIDQGAKP